MSAELADAKGPLREHLLGQRADSLRELAEIDRDLAEVAGLPCAEERALLGSAFITGRVPAGVRVEDLATEAHRAILAACMRVEASGSACDLVTVESELSRNGQLERAGGPGYLARLLDDVPNLDNAERYARLVHEAGVRRRVVVEARRIAHEAETLSLDTLRERLSALPAIVEKEFSPEEAEEARPAALTLAEFVKIPRAERDWLIPNLIPAQGVCVLSADYYVGKSTLAAQLAACLAAGREFLGFPIPKAIPTLYMQREGNPRIFAERVACACHHLGLFVETLPLFFPPVDFLAPFESEEFGAFIGRTGARFVVCDTTFFFTNGADENDANDWKRCVVVPLKTLCRRYDSTFFLTHHYGKPSDTRQGRHKPRGSSAIGDDSDTVMRLEVVDPDHRSLIFDKVKDAPEVPALSLFFDKSTATFARDDQAPEAHATAEDEKQRAEREARLAKVWDGIVRQLRKNPDGLKKSDLLETLSCRNKDLGDVLAEREKAGQLLYEPASGRGGGKLWKLPR